MREEKQANISVIDNYGKAVKLIVPVKEGFEYMEHNFIVHRPHEYLKAKNKEQQRKYSFWLVSERSTGFRICSGRIIQNAIVEGKKRLERVGKECLEEAVEGTVKKHGRIN